MNALIAVVCLLLMAGLIFLICSKHVRTWPRRLPLLAILSVATFFACYNGTKAAFNFFMQH